MSAEQPLCKRGHVKDGLRHQRRVRKSGKIVYYDTIYCTICTNLREHAGYITVRVSRMLANDVAERAVSNGVSLRTELQAVITRGLAAKETKR